MSVRMEWHGDKVLDAIDDAIMKGLRQCAEFLLELARALAPIETGDLVRSGTTSSDASRMAVAVAFAMIYAARQHEEMTWRHASGRTSKYLETPWLANTATWLLFIQASVREVTR